MKKCIVVSGPTRFAALAFKDGFTASIRKVAQLGYDAVELAIRDPRAIDVEDIEKLLASVSLPVAAIGTGQAYGDEGLSFTDPEESVRQKAIQRVKDHIALAARWQSQVIIGLIRGKVTAGTPRELAQSWLVAALQECCALAEQQGVNLVLEPINRYETDLINTIAEAIELIRLVGSDNLKILADTFHMNIEEPSIVESIKTAGPYLTHFHIADSNRWAPGYGHLDFPSIISTLKEINYQGAVSAEILPKPDPETCAGATINYLVRLGL
ncbi:sugar phosphate isomerase/epimerase [Desulfofundulus luciae]|uniref:Sugar phosphate isomerase/epimerase n=1 Tax=Desulfofundulus luciae TaxID=74702 RepID=A0ABU0B0D7_9FIRM|nr:5-keto-L-gluconate epimerase [Desulfofundulus luciae]MDQ0285978.1 sugar phosphate isomerase/epimerase [Desulfofundulus luciae]